MDIICVKLKDNIKEELFSAVYVVWLVATQIVRNLLLDSTDKTSDKVFISKTFTKRLTKSDKKFSSIWFFIQNYRFLVLKLNRCQNYYNKFFY